jgi:hypothetical protein
MTTISPGTTGCLRPICAGIEPPRNQALLELPFWHILMYMATTGGSCAAYREDIHE